MQTLDASGFFLLVLVLLGSERPGRLEEDGKGGEEGDEDSDFDRRYGMSGGGGGGGVGVRGGMPDGMGAMLKRTVPLMEAALAFNAKSTALRNYPPPRPKGSIAGSAYTVHCSLAPPPFAMRARLQCTGVDWNAAGALVVAAFGRLDLNGWCSKPGMIAAWPVFRRDFKASAASSRPPRPPRPRPRLRTRRRGHAGALVLPHVRGVPPDHALARGRGLLQQR